eukprot:g19851.t1
MTEESSGLLQVEVLSAGTDDRPLLRSDKVRAEKPVVLVSVGERRSKALKEGKAAKFQVFEILGADLLIFTFDRASSKFELGVEEKAFCGGCVLPLCAILQPEHNSGLGVALESSLRQNSFGVTLQLQLLPLPLLRTRRKLQRGDLSGEKLRFVLNLEDRCLSSICLMLSLVFCLPLCLASLVAQWICSSGLWRYLLWIPGSILFLPKAMRLVIFQELQRAQDLKQQLLGDELGRTVAGGGDPGLGSAGSNKYWHFIRCGEDALTMEIALQTRCTYSVMTSKAGLDTDKAKDEKASKDGLSQVVSEIGDVVRSRRKAGRHSGVDHLQGAIKTIRHHHLDGLVMVGNLANQVDTAFLAEACAAERLPTKSLPNAAAICQQYFAFRRHAGESMQSFLVRESLGYAEFSEAIIRLYEEKRGVLQQDLDFDLPDEEDDAAAADVTWWDEYGAGLTAEDMRDIISTTKGSLEFETVTAALQTLWDEQLLGRRSNGSSSRAMESFVVEEHEEEADTSWWDDAYAAEADHHDDDWWEDEQWDYAALDEPETVPEDDEAVKEAQKAEKIAEGLAMEAQRTWTEAQRATQALKKDRGFGHVIGAGKGATTTCWNCGGRHYARDCPDRRHPGMTKGRPKGWKGNYMTEYDTALLKGKGKSKKGKNHHWMEAQAFQKGRGKGKKSAAPRPSVNAYANEMFGLEIASSSMEANSLSSMSRMAPQQGLIDCGATASAAPQIAVENLIASVLAKDSQATVDIHKNARPYFRFGNVSQAESGEILWDIKSATEEKPAPQPFDESRKTTMDPRDPRADPGQWPCYGQRIPDKPRANPHGQWTHCGVCDLRLQYVPRKGSHGQTTQNRSPPLCKKMLQELYKVMEGRQPTAALCLAMQKKVDADEALDGMVQPVKQRVKKPSTMPPFYDESKKKEEKTAPSSSASTESWDLAPSTSPTRAQVLQDMEENMTTDELKHLMRVIQERKLRSQVITVDEEDNPNALDPASI